MIVSDDEAMELDEADDGDTILGFVEGVTSMCHICHKEYKDMYHHYQYFHSELLLFIL